MSTVDDRKVNEPFGLGKTLRSAFPLLRWSSRCVQRYYGIPLLIYISLQRHFFCNDIDKYNFVNSNCIFILLLQPNITLLLHWVLAKLCFLPSLLQT